MRRNYLFLVLVFQPCRAGVLQDFAEKVGRGDLEGLLTLSPDLTADQRGAVAPGQRLGEELRAAVRQLLPRILGPCRGPQLADLPRQEMLAELEKGNQRLSNFSRDLLAAEHSATPSAPLQAVLAAVASRTRLEGSMAPDCRMLKSVIPEGSCDLIVNVGLMCFWSLLQAAERSEHFDTWAFEGLPDTSDWRFHGDMGDSPSETLSALLTAKHGAVRLAEVGVFQGNFSLELLQRLPALELLLVDPYHLRSAQVASDQPQGRSLEALEVAAAKLQPFRARATHLVQQSTQAAEWLERNSLDCVYVDGDHSYEGCASDLSAWWPVLKKDGIMAGHDYTLIWPGVVQAVNRFAAQHGLQVHFTAETWWMVKS